MISGTPLDRAARAFDASLERIRREFAETMDVGQAARAIQNRLAELAKVYEVDPGHILAAHTMLIRVSIY